jgi:hypothetical protein
VTYHYSPARPLLDKPLRIKDEAGLPIARQIDFALERYCKEYEKNPEFRDATKRYAKGELPRLNGYGRTQG